MKKSVMTVAAVGMSGVMTCCLALSTIGNAVMVANEQPLAGMNLSIEKYVEIEDEKSREGGELFQGQNDVNEEASATEEDLVSILHPSPEVGMDAALEGGQPVEPTVIVTDEGQTAPEGDAVVDGALAAEEVQEAEEITEEKKREHLKTNLVYDRLGIAKVDTYLNVRKRPGESSKVVGKMSRHAGSHVYNIKKGWAKIVSGKVRGYVKAKYLVTDQKAEDMAMNVGTYMATVNTPALMVRSLPSTDATMYSAIAQGEDFDVVKENLTKEWLEGFMDKHTSKKEMKKVKMDAVMADLDNWICIRVDSDKAFVAKEYVKMAYKLERAVRIGDLATDGSDGVSSTRASLVQYAKQFLGNRYVYGGSSLTGGTDCSGFSMSVFAHFGYGLPRTSGAQAASTRSISSSEARPGDLFFYSNGSRINHVAIYIGGGMVIHASTPRSGIKISNAYYRSPAKIGRVISD